MDFLILHNLLDFINNNVYIIDTASYFFLNLNNVIQLAYQSFLSDLFFKHFFNDKGQLALEGSFQQLVTVVAKIKLKKVVRTCVAAFIVKKFICHKFTELHMLYAIYYFLRLTSFLVEYAEAYKL